MADLETIRRIALSLPGTTAATDSIAFSVTVKGKEKGHAWSWKERLQPKKARVENPDVLAVRVSGEDEKQMLLASDSRKFFTEPHYNGYPAVLVRIAEVGEEEMRELLTEAWRILAPKELTTEFNIGKE